MQVTPVCGTAGRASPCVLTIAGKCDMLIQVLEAERIKVAWYTAELLEWAQVEPRMVLWPLGGSRSVGSAIHSLATSPMMW